MQSAFFLALPLEDASHFSSACFLGSESLKENMKMTSADVRCPSASGAGGAGATVSGPGLSPSERELGLPRTAARLFGGGSLVGLGLLRRGSRLLGSLVSGASAGFPPPHAGEQETEQGTTDK